MLDFYQTQRPTVTSKSVCNTTVGQNETYSKNAHVLKLPIPLTSLLAHRNRFRQLSITKTRLVGACHAP